MSDPTEAEPDDADEATAPADDGMAPIITNTGAGDDDAGDDADAPTG